MSVLIKAQMEAVYRRNCDMIYRICLIHLKHEQDAFDAVHLSEEKNSRCLTISAINMKRKKYRMPKVAVAACLLAIIVPTVGFAGEKIAAYMLPIANPLSYIKEAGEHTEFDWREFERGEQNIYYRDNMPIWISDSDSELRMSALHHFHFIAADSTQTVLPDNERPEPDKIRSALQYFPG